jgi:predicted GNAT family acetyltransferase
MVVMAVETVHEHRVSWIAGVWTQAEQQNQGLRGYLDLHH